MKRIVILLLVGFVLASCGLSHQNPNIFEKPVCNPPCWENITPGITTKADALVILSKIDFVEQPSIDMNRPAIGFDDEIRFSAYNYHPISGSLFISRDRVSMIAFEFNLGTTMQHAIDWFGAPENILVVHTSFFDQITLLNIRKGFEFNYKLFGNQNQYLDSSKIEPDSEVFGVLFFDPNQYQQVLNSRILAAYTLTPDEIKSNLRPWAGYGSFKDKYWPPATQPPQ